MSFSPVNRLSHALQHIAQIPERHEERFQKADQNGDGQLSRDEFNSAAGHKGDGRHGARRVQRTFERLDLNKDGAISRDEAEFHAQDKQARAFLSAINRTADVLERKLDRILEIDDRAAGRFDRADGDGDGELTFEEFSQAHGRRRLGDRALKRLEARFDRLDSDGNGTISRDEALERAQDRQVSALDRLNGELQAFRDFVLSVQETLSGVAAPPPADDGSTLSGTGETVETTVTLAADADAPPADETVAATEDPAAAPLAETGEARADEPADPVVAEATGVETSASPEVLADQQTDPALQLLSAQGSQQIQPGARQIVLNYTQVSITTTTVSITA